MSRRLPGWFGASDVHGYHEARYPIRDYDWVMTKARARHSGRKLPKVQERRAELQTEFASLCAEFYAAPDERLRDQATKVGHQLLEMIRTEKLILTYAFKF